MPRGPLIAAAATAGCGLVLAGTGALALGSPTGNWYDHATLEGFAALNQAGRTPRLERLAGLADPGPYVLFGFGLAMVAAVRGRLRTAVAIPAVLVASGLTTTILKPVLARPRTGVWVGPGQVPDASWPSGHAGAAMALALMAVLAAPRPWRPTVMALGAGFAIAVSSSILALRWHLPSDVVGGFLVAAFWSLVAVTVLSALERLRPARTAPEPRLQPVHLVPAGLLVAAGALAAASVVLDRPLALLQFAQTYSSFAVGVAVIASAAAAIATAVGALTPLADPTAARNVNVDSSPEIRG